MIIEGDSGGGGGMPSNATRGRELYILYSLCYFVIIMREFEETQLRLSSVCKVVVNSQRGSHFLLLLFKLNNVF